MNTTTRIAAILAVLGLVGAIWAGQPGNLAAAQQDRVSQPRPQDQAQGNQGNGQALQTQDISLQQAQAVVAAAMEKAREQGTKMDIAVVDAGGNLKAFARMDGAWLGSIDIAIKKAKTARMFDMPTGELGKLSQPGGPLWQIEVSNDGLITFPGGVPIKVGDTIIGAVGVSGSTVENDHAAAQAGAAALE